MAITQVTSGTQTATISTEHTLTTQTAAEIYVLAVNLANMASGDTTTLRVKTKVLTGGASTLAFEQQYVGAQTEDVSYSPPIPSAHQIVVTLQQTAGTGRSYEWSLLKVG